VQIDAEGHKVIVIFDHFGHAWSIKQRDKTNGGQAA
jgi:uncharacterized glyoxalase superfamily protein PhnB